jgi:hypothetical protein
VNLDTPIPLADLHVVLGGKPKDVRTWHEEGRLKTFMSGHQKMILARHLVGLPYRRPATLDDVLAMSRPGVDDIWISTHEAAAMKNCCPESIIYRIRRGDIRSRVINKALYVRRDEVEQLHFDPASHEWGRERGKKKRAETIKRYGAIFARMKELRSEGHPFRVVAEKVNEEHSLYRGKPWNEQTARHLYGRMEEITSETISPSIEKKEANESV